ncbi:S-adenosylmethionine:tRNA ribosyltransferase-isomerase [Flammeovirga kamogawensis]|uniref:S-adenosylmethionine:tRNA ribosyltransferase-isomerase n=1 Tax=Flammeovirga kamogawensis TaxID=373891 RepID=A0ABX8GXL9_9BACT|nr:S-adenosylmethionine:tRNA ribosyltransferase-isomerase [Flammeovirga kamogawensis]MBB6461295.1 S-adenosylmethionine:tRNA ribosyltransferase-isomerase [Flammeovirga kamogawensis]QWG07852.1 S-adenosylmethionine:tRNA ribosyltransferase-isomerase [Flammeovirga kamogawensis]TRX69659.1 S-adenosylmethionine:tRNA ribosyltransferase-isomerase [Flammeovirga kamogawensis]
MDKDIQLPQIDLNNYQYDLPTGRIAKHPHSPRDESKLMLYKNGNISHKVFKDIVGELDADYTLFFNNTKVLPARLYFQKETGANIEVFLLNPIKPTRDISAAMLAESGTVWECAIGNYKRWKDQSLVSAVNVEGEIVKLTVSHDDRTKRFVKFEWDNPSLKFVDIISAAGNTPLPPYIKRAATEEDKDTYQTVYSKNEGAVAAPTAGLHFTKDVLAKLAAKGVKEEEVTLHVSAGTFKPISADIVTDHEMHNEQVIVTQENIKALIDAKKVACVGTTSMRTLESTYWFGVRLIHEGDTATFDIHKLEAYQKVAEHSSLPSRQESFRAVLDYMIKKDISTLSGETSIFIMPGYQFRVIDALVTNFHLPSTTLVLLIAAFIGEDWRKVYNQALDNEYRFLSYGDSSLLFRN